MLLLISLSDLLLLQLKSTISKSLLELQAFNLGSANGQPPAHQ
jgi:hypothetical protein